MTIATESQLAQLFAAGDNYDRWLAWLKSVRPRYVGTPMLAKIDATIASGEAKKSTIATTLQAARDAWKWAQEQGVAAWTALKSAVGLGAVPAIPVAYWVSALAATSVLAALGVMNNWINTEAARTRDELAQYDKDVERLLKEGVPAKDALKIAAGIQEQRAESDKKKNEDGIGQKIVDKAGTIVLWLAVGYAGWKWAERKGWV